MIAKYLNKYDDNKLTYFDLSFEENDEQLLRLGGVVFEEGFTEQNMIDRATEIFEGNFTDKTLTDVIII